MVSLAGVTVGFFGLWAYIGSNAIMIDIKSEIESFFHPDPGEDHLWDTQGEQQSPVIQLKIIQDLRKMLVNWGWDQQTVLRLDDKSLMDAANNLSPEKITKRTLSD